ncbi:MAG: hypothetical protein JWO09_2328 [Bacteroidetes bacterium]|nr:hypothetical protein [Bacteroidota bacterium]
MNKLKLTGGFFSAFIFLLVMSRCKSPDYNAKYHTAIKVSIPVPERMAEIRQELLKSGVDTMFVYARECQHCYGQAVIGKRSEEKKGADYSLLIYSSPSYIFWVSKGTYFVKKVDQFYEYETIKRWDFTQIPLYDYFLRNKPEIERESLFNGRRDTVAGYGINGVIPTEIKITYGLYYEMDRTFISRKRLANSSTYIQFSIPGFTFEKTLEDQYFLPVAGKKEEQKLLAEYREMYPRDSTIIVNTRENYMKNRDMKLYLWSKIVDSELLEIEMQKLWVPVSYNKGRKR